MFRRLFGAKPPQVEPDAAPPIIVVSGLPRSGTSLMMTMLAAGGLLVLTDALRTADEDNPHGYYEFERVKQLDKGDHAWLEHAPGKAVKIVSALLVHLPATHDYQVIFMRRNLAEVLASQRKMLAHRGEVADAAHDAEMAALFEKHLVATQAWLQTQPNIRVLEIDYNGLLSDPVPHLRQLTTFLHRPLDQTKMAQVIDPALYRNRAEKG